MSGKSTEKELGDLHGTVARVLRSQLEDTITVRDEETGEEKELNVATPAMIAVAVKFLKDNKITSSVDDDDNLGELEDLLERKRKKRAERRGDLRLVSGEEE